MTSPQQRADTLGDQLLDVIASASSLAVGGFPHAVRLLVQSLTARWVLDFGDIEGHPEDTDAAARFVDFARGEIERLDLDDGAQAALESATEAGYRLGQADALDLVPEGTLIPPETVERAVPDLADVLAAQRAKALLGLDERALVDRGFPAVVQQVATLARTTTRVEATVAAETTRASSEAVRAVAAAAGMRVMWVAERGGCLHCLAYAGHVVDPAEPFPPGLTFDERPLVQPGPLLGPPAHPHCRCVLQPLAEQDEAIAVGLRREARRSVLRGWSESDGLGPRLRAAERLLGSGAGLPKTVEQRARRSVRDGRFPAEPIPGPERRPAPDPEPDPDPIPAESERNPADLDDAELDDAMQAAIAAEDYDLLETLSQEADRRDEEKTSGPQLAAMSDQEFDDAWGTADTGDVDTDPEDEARYGRMEELLAAGVDEATAYAEVFGVDEDRVRKDEVIRQLRAAGHGGSGFEALARAAYRDQVAEAINLADEATNGYMLNKLGHRAGIDPYSLFTGPLVRAAKYASDELKDWWEANDRVTFEEFKAALLGRDSRASGSGRLIRR